MKLPPSFSCQDRTSRAVGLQGRVFHDLRRSAVREFDRAGVSQRVTMQLIGHTSVAMWVRYRMVDEQELREAMAQREAAEVPRRTVQKLPRRS